MKIKCYLFTGMTKQLNHTYYSLGINKGLRFYYNFIDYFEEEDGFRFRPFVYEIELDSEDVFKVSYSYLEATKFKVVRFVEFNEIIKDLELSARTRNELNSILSGTANNNNIVQQYKKFFRKEYAELSEVERYKFLAIVSQKDYDLPVITFSNYQNLSYVRVLEFYGRPHKSTLTPVRQSSFERYGREVLYGKKEFEYLTDCSMGDVVKSYNYHSYMFLQNRSLPQERFEEYCEYMLAQYGCIHYIDECIGAGYKIPKKYEEQFYPYVIYSNPELALDLVEKNLNASDYTTLLFLRKGYKIKGIDYENDRRLNSIQEAKKIFMKADYKYI